MDQKTIRQQIRELLSFSQMNAREISQEVHISEKEVYEHLMHINRSLAATHKKMGIEPAACLHCGYVFHDRRRYSPPGHCPKCKQTHIQCPLYFIR